MKNARHKKSLAPCRRHPFWKRETQVQYSFINQEDHSGCLILVTGKNSFITGFISRMGVPSIASKYFTHILFPSHFTSSTIVKPTELGRSFFSCAKMPTSGQLVFPRGWPLKIIFDLSRWKIISR